MNKPVIDRWIERLESGKIPQSARRLGFQDGSRCCLGVLCDIAVEDGIIPPPAISPIDGSLAYGSEATRDVLPEVVTNWVGLVLSNGGWAEYEVTSLAEKNDDGATFEEIAAILRNPPKGLLVDD